MIVFVIISLALILFHLNPYILLWKLEFCNKLFQYATLSLKQLSFLLMYLFWNPNFFKSVIVCQSKTLLLNYTWIINNINI